MAEPNRMAGPYRATSSSAVAIAVVLTALACASESLPGLWRLLGLPAAAAAALAWASLPTTASAERRGRDGRSGGWPARDSSGEHLRRLVEEIPAAIGVISADGRILYENTTFGALLGRDPEARVGRSAFEHIHPDDVAGVRRSIEESLSAPGQVVLWRARFRHEGGELRWLEGEAKNLLGDPLVDGIVISGRDASDRHQLRARIEMFQKAVEQSPVSVVITDLAGSIEYVNPKFCAVTGYEVNEVLGANPRVLKGGETSDEVYRDLWQTVRAGGEWRGEFHNRRKDGQLFWERASISAIKDDDGRPTHLLAVKEDVTAERSDRAKLVASEAKFRTLTEQAHDGVILMDAEGRVAFWNAGAEKILGYMACEALGRDVHELLAPPRFRDAQRTALPMFRANGSGSVVGRTVELTALHRDGREISVELSLASAQGADGWNAIAILRDTSERQAAETSLREAMGGLERANADLLRERAERARVESELFLAHKLEAVGQLAAGIAHEINTPMQFIGDSAQFLATAMPGLSEAFAAFRTVAQSLTAIPGHEGELAELQRVLDETDVDYSLEEFPRSLSRIASGVERVSVLVKAMKEFGHPGQREMAPADVNHLLQTTLVVAHNEYKYVANIDSEFGELPPVPCVAGELNQVFLNLLVNAAHAIAEKTKDTQERGLITISTRMDGDAAVVEITDSGGGIPTAIRTRVFEPFFTTKPAGKGTGQGLAIARSIVVDRHGGTLDFTSTPGEGTTFTIRLPIGAEHSSDEVAA